MANSGAHGTKGRTKKFNYDPEMGLMPEIEKLTSPSGKAVKPAAAHLEKDPPTSNRNWKSVNTQYCIVCREGGELLCCDACPASFHLICHEPVILRDQIPEGKWLCNRCKNTPSSDLPAKNSYDPNETEEERNRRAFVRAMVGKDAEEDPLSMLAGAALAVNAQIFQLPSSYGMDEPMPFDEMRPSRQPLYGEQCWFCQKIVPEMILTKCDFCPGVYHLDCLDPPLCSIPKEKWMCPNHAELIVDQKLLTSQSRTERMNLWKKYARQEVHEVAILRKFVAKIQEEQKKNEQRAANGSTTATTSKSNAKRDQPCTSKNGAAGSKNSCWNVPKNPKPKVEVHAALKDMYKERWDGADERVQLATEAERESWINTLAQMQADCVSARVLAGGGGHRKKPQQLQLEAPASHLPIAKPGRPRKRKLEMSPEQQQRYDVARTMRFIVDSIVRKENASSKRVTFGITSFGPSSERKKYIADPFVKPTSLNANNSDTRGIVQALNERILKGIRANAASDYIKMEEDMPCSSSTVNNMTMNGRLLNGSSHEDSKHYEQKQEAVTRSDKDRMRNDLMNECKKRLLEAKTPLDRQIAALAVQRMEQMEHCAVVIKETSSARRTRVKPTFNSRFFLPDKPIIAVLRAENDFLPFAIQRSVTSIGTSEDCHILLSGKNRDHGCAVQALHHVTILFDRVSNRFQLIPFNRNRVCVNGIWYGSVLPPPSFVCSCLPIEPDGTPKKAIQDQPVQLTHGSTITIGCTTFVFASFY